MDSGRLEAFSDGVFAVAITLLVFNIAVPGPGPHNPSLAAQLTDHWPAFGAYVVSFLTIGIIWVNHHALFASFARVDRALLFFNLLLLFFVVTIPFAASTLSAYLRHNNADSALAAAIFQGVFLGMSLAFGAMTWWAIRRGHFRRQMSPREARVALIRFAGGNIFYAVALGVAFVSAPISLLMSGLLAIYYMFEQTPAQD